MNMWFAAAAVLAVLTCGIHVVLGGREAARPLLIASNLDLGAKYTNYYCWHLVTIVIGALAFAYGYSAWTAEPGLALFATAMAFLFAAWSLGMIALFRLRPFQFGQWALFLPMAALGLVGGLP